MFTKKRTGYTELPTPGLEEKLGNGDLAGSFVKSQQISITESHKRYVDTHYISYIR